MFSDMKNRQICKKLHLCIKKFSGASSCRIPYVCNIIVQFDNLSEQIAREDIFASTIKTNISFLLSDWYQRPSGPAEGAECCAADAPGQSGPRYNQPTGSRRQWVGYRILMSGRPVAINTCTSQKSIPY